MDEWIRVREAADLLGTSVQCVYTRIRKNHLTAISIIDPERRAMFVLAQQVTDLCDSARQLESGDWITIGEAAEIIGIQRSGVNRRLKAGKFTALRTYKLAGATPTGVYLSRQEVEAQRASKLFRPLPSLPDLSPAEIGYMAAIIDGEGCIGIYRRKRGDRRSDGHAIRITITNTDRRLIDWIHERFGGVTWTDNRDRQACPERWKPSHIWASHNAAACQILTLVLPHLVIKGAQARLALAFREHIEEEKRLAPRRVEPAELQWRREQIARLHRLNRRGRLPSEPAP